MEFPDGTKRLIGIVHQRIRIRIEMYDGTVTESGEGDDILAMAEGKSSLINFRVDMTEVAKLPAFTDE